MGGKPAISVVMPVYNGERFLAEAIESILAQTFTDFEFIVVDDGSTDGSLEIIRRYRDDRVVPVALPHGGLVRALNEGIRRARAELIARMDGDDIADRGRFLEQERFLRAHTDVALLGTACRVVDVGGRLLGTRCLPTDDAVIRKFMAARSQFVHPTMMIRSRCYREIGLYRDVVPEDYDFFVRVLTRFRGANLPVPLHSMRFHEASYTFRHREESVRYHERFRRELLAKMGTLSIAFDGEIPDDNRLVEHPRRGSREYDLWMWEMQTRLGVCYARRGHDWKGRREMGRGLRYCSSFRKVLKTLSCLMGFDRRALVGE